MEPLDRFLKEWDSPEPFVSAQTSGSTGSPKIINLLKADMEVSARATCSFFEISERSHLYLPLSCDYIAGKMQVVRSKISGAALTAVKPSSTHFSHDNCTYDLIPIVPAQIEGLLKSGIDFRYVIIGGAPLSYEQEKMCLGCGRGTFYATYGMTETCSHVALRKLGETHYEALPGVTFNQSPDQCLIIKHQQMSFRELVTNDIVKLLSPTSFQFLGRKDFVINSGGIKIHPEEVEHALAPLLPARKFYVTSRPSPRWGQEAVLVIYHGDKVCKDFFLSQARILLGKKCPKDIYYDFNPTFTKTGKLIRRQF